MEVKDEIYNLRISNDKTQQEFANLVGVSKATINMWESGKRNPSARMVLRLLIQCKKRGYAISDDLVNKYQLDNYMSVDDLYDNVITHKQPTGRVAHHSEMIYPATTQEFMHEINKSASHIEYLINAYSHNARNDEEIILKGFRNAPQNIKDGILSMLKPYCDGEDD